MSYRVVDAREFDWSVGKKCYLYLVLCESCNSRSMHLSFSQIVQRSAHTGVISFKVKEIDEALFASVPTSLFAIDARIPRVLRELLTEAEGCLKSNFLTGASACARKVVYELAVKERAEGDNYDDRLKSLKAKRPDVDPSFFDTLLTIQEITSSKVHEESSDAWESKHLRLILATLHQILFALYVEPAERERRRQEILAMKADVMSPKRVEPETDRTQLVDGETSASLESEGDDSSSEPQRTTTGSDLAC